MSKALSKPSQRRADAAWASLAQSTSLYSSGFHGVWYIRASQSQVSGLQGRGGGGSGEMPEIPRNPGCQHSWASTSALNPTEALKTPKTGPRPQHPSHLTRASHAKAPSGEGQPGKACSWTLFLGSACRFIVTRCWGFKCFELELEAFYDFGLGRRLGAPHITYLAPI